MEREIVTIVLMLNAKKGVLTSYATFTTELAMFCTHINRYLGYGKVRLQRMLDTMSNYNGDCLAEMEEIGITFKGFDEYIFTEKEERKQKIHRDELLHLERGREALRALQEDKGRNEQHKSV